MKTYSEVTIPPQPERIVLQAVTLACDLCKREIKRFEENGVTVLNSEIRQRYGNVLEVLVQLRAGEENLDGGAGETTSFDLCPECFEERLKPWLEQQGARAKVEVW